MNDETYNNEPLDSVNQPYEPSVCRDRSPRTANDIYEELAIIFKCTRQDAKVALWTWASNTAGIYDVAQPGVKDAADVYHLKQELDSKCQTIHKLRKQVATLVELLQEFTHYSVTYND